MTLEISVQSCSEYQEDKNGIPLDATHIMPCTGSYWKAGPTGMACTTGFNNWLQTGWSNKELTTYTNMFKEINQ